MNKLDLLKKVMNIMESKMALYGFTKSFAQQKFRKEKDKDFIIAYSLAITNRFNMKRNKSGVTIDPAIYVHNKLVEKVYAKVTTRDLDYITDLKTIGNTLADLIANPSGQYLIRNQRMELFYYSESDIADIADRLIILFEDFVIPYFEKYATWEGLNSIFNNNLEYNVVHCNIEPERSLRGLIVAKLIDRPDIENLIQIHGTRIKEKGNENYQIEFRKLLGILDTIKPVIPLQ